MRMSIVYFMHISWYYIIALSQIKTVSSLGFRLYWLGRSWFVSADIASWFAPADTVVRIGWRGKAMILRHSLNECIVQSTPLHEYPSAVDVWHIWRQRRNHHPLVKYCRFRECVAFRDCWLEPKWLHLLRTTQSMEFGPRGSYSFWNRYSFKKRDWPFLKIREGRKRGSAFGRE